VDISPTEADIDNYRLCQWVIGHRHRSVCHLTKFRMITYKKILSGRHVSKLKPEVEPTIGVVVSNLTPGHTLPPIKISLPNLLCWWKSEVPEHVNGQNTLLPNI